MAKVGLFFGSSTGKTEAVAYRIQEEFHKVEPGSVDVINIGAATPEQVLSYQYLIFGIPTWNTGELQDDWDIFLPKFQTMDMTGKKVAIFGLGDQNGYGFNFLDAAGILADAVLPRGAELYGLWETGSYQFEESKARIEDENVFVSLGIDEDGQSDMTSKRIAEWSKQIREEFFV
jgi:flavodoxin I